MRRLSLNIARVWLVSAVLAAIALGIEAAQPGDRSQANVGGASHASAFQSFYFSGTKWGSVPFSLRSAINAADNEWLLRTDWDPFVSGATPPSIHNGLYWDEANSLGRPPLAHNGLTVAFTTPALAGPSTFRETDIQFNPFPGAGWNWTAALIQGVTTHEFGHAAGLTHDSATLPGCTGGNPNTMCPGAPLIIFDQFRVISLATLETKDISDVNSLY